MKKMNMTYKMSLIQNEYCRSIDVYSRAHQFQGNGWDTPVGHDPSLQLRAECMCECLILSVTVFLR